MTDLSKSPARIAGMFDAIAARYDFLNHLLSAGHRSALAPPCHRVARVEGGERVLDLCTGTADVALAAASVSPPPARVVGVDFSGAMLQVGVGKMRTARLGDRIALVRGDATRIPVADASVDAVTIAFGIRNVENVQAACDEMRRVVRPGGRLAILEFAVPTLPGVRALYSLVLSPRPAADRAPVLAPSGRLRLFAGLGWRVRHAC